MQETANPENPAPLAADERPLRHGVARAALASGAAETATRVLMVALSIATARALLPGQVGVLGLAVIVVGIVSLIAACCETAGVIGRYEGSDTQHAVAATLIRGLIVAALVAGVYLCLPVAPRLLAGAENAESDLGYLIRILLLIPVLELAACYPRVLLQRKLDLAYIAGATFLQAAAHVSLSVVLLWRGYGAAGIVWSSVLSTALGAAAVWLRVLGTRGPRWTGMPGASLRRNTLLGTAKVLAGGFVGYLNGRVDNLLVAGAIGPTAMSFYGMAWSASRMAPQILGQALGFVLVPALAQIQTDTKRVERALAESIRHSYLLVVPLSAALFVAAPSLVAVVLGAKWAPMVPCLRIMSITILAAPLVSASNAALVAAGRTHMTGLASLGHLIVLGILIVPLCRRWGILGAAYGDFCGVAVLTVTLCICTPSIRRALKHLALGTLLPTLAAGVISGAAVWMAGAQVPDGILRLLAEGATMLGVYPAALWLVGGRTALSSLLSLVRTVVQPAPSAPRVSPSHP